MEIILYTDRSDLNLCLQPVDLDHSEARNDRGRRVKLEFKTYVMKLLRFESHNIMFLCLFRKGPIFEPKNSCTTNGLNALFY